MKPLIIIPKGAMSAKDKEKLTKNNICIVAHAMDHDGSMNDDDSDDD
jgi:hypothetical protein